MPVLKNNKNTISDGVVSAYFDFSNGSRSSRLPRSSVSDDTIGFVPADSTATNVRRSVIRTGVHADFRLPRCRKNVEKIRLRTSILPPPYCCDLRSLVVGSGGSRVTRSLCVNQSDRRPRATPIRGLSIPRLFFGTFRVRNPRPRLVATFTTQRTPRQAVAPVGANIAFDIWNGGEGEAEALTNS